MYFIYPASVSENCDPRIVPAVAKCIERFFLVQLQDAMATGVLSLKRKFKGSGKYSPLIMESLNNYNKKQILAEKYSVNDKNLSDYEKARLNMDEDKENYRRQKDSDDLKRRKEKEDAEAKERQEEKNYRRQREEEEKKYRREREEEEKEKEERESYRRSSGSYAPMQTTVDILPTSATVSVPVLYKGGPLDNKVDRDVEININVKVIPTIIKNFKNLEDSLLDDYFSKKSEAFYKSVGRNVARKCFGIVRRLPFGIGDAIYDAAVGDDEAKHDVIYQSQSFVDASAFHKSPNSPNNYNFTSNVVIFNKDDLTDPEDSNMFRNRSAMVRLFKMGWSTFAMLDPINEVMYFISSLDGGYMHEIPYRYMMESIKSKAYYGDNDRKLKDSARPFMIKKGNFNTFARMFED